MYSIPQVLQVPAFSLPLPLQCDGQMYGESYSMFAVLVLLESAAGFAVESAFFAEFEVWLLHAQMNKT